MWGGNVSHKQTQQEAANLTKRVRLWTAKHWKVLVTNQTNNLLAARPQCKILPQEMMGKKLKKERMRGETRTTNAIIFTPALLFGRTAVHLRT